MKKIVIDTTVCDQCGGTGEMPNHYMMVPDDMSREMINHAIRRYKEEMERLRSNGVNPDKGDFR